MASIDHAIEDAVSLNAMELLPEMKAAGVKAVKIEGRQRSPVYVAQVTKIWREALDSFERNPSSFVPKPEWTAALGKVSEGAQTPSAPTTGLGNELPYRHG